MYSVTALSSDLYFVGASDRRLALFENIYPIPRGVSYNSYLFIDNNTVLIDVVDKAVSQLFFENVEAVLGNRELDYLIVNHTEPDHIATMSDLVLRYPNMKIIGNTKTISILKQFFTFDVDSRALVVKEGDTFSSGKHNFQFVSAPMVHWPEVMVTYDTTDKILFSADAFGTFGALNGSVYADKVDFETEWLADARRYYTNIVGKYGTQVQSLLKKAATLDIQMICPLHGPIWRTNIGWFIEKYIKWSGYIPEKSGVLILYGSIYGGTANVADILATKLAAKDIDTAVYDVSVTDGSYLVAECFKYSHIIFASATYNNGIFTPMENLLLDLKAHNLQKRTVAIVQNGSWSPNSGKLMREILDTMKDMTILDTTLTFRSTLKEEQMADVDAMVDCFAAMLGHEETLRPIDESIIDNLAFRKFSYSLFVTTAKQGEKDNGCIINTAIQITENPKRILFAINKNNLTHDMILATGIFNISILSEKAPFSVFERFGFQSGHNSNKFEESNEPRSENGIYYIPSQYANAFISGRVIATEDNITHTVITAEVTEAKVLSDIPTMTYSYYFANVKPKPQPKTESASNKKRFVCTICGYVHESESLPADFLCPICKHGIDVFVEEK